MYGKNGKEADELPIFNVRNRAASIRRLIELTPERVSEKVNWPGQMGKGLEDGL